MARVSSLPLSSETADGMILGMTATSQGEPNTYPYALEIIPPKLEGGSYHWAIRKHGKLHERSDRGFRSEASARHQGLAQIERLLSVAGER